MLWTDFAENQIIDFFRGQGITLPTDWHVGLIVDFDSDGSYVEVVDSDYARQPITRALTAWAGTQGAGSVLASTGSSHATSNNAEVDFGLSSFAATISHYGIFDAADGGELWAVVPLPSPVPVGIGDPITITAGDLAVTLGLSGGLSNYASNKLIDLLFRGQAYTWPASTYAAYTTTLPTNATPGIEPSSGTGYARVAIASSLTAWSGTDADGSTALSTGDSGRMSNNATILAPTPTAPQGEAVGSMLMDSATGGNMLFRGPLLSGGVPASFTVPAGQAPRWDPGQFGVTVR